MDDGTHSGAQTSGNGQPTVFLALFLLLLAFFIVLTAISQHEQKRTAAAIGSIAAEFRSGGSGLPIELRRPEAVPPAWTGNFHDDMRRLLEATLPILRFDANRQGDVMRVTLPARMLFTPEGTELRSRARLLLDGIAGAFARQGAEARHEVELLLGAGRELPPYADAASQLSVRRAGVFARALAERGVPQHAILIGLRRGDPDQAQITFYRRDDVRWKPAGGGPR